MTDQTTAAFRGLGHVITLCLNSASRSSSIFLCPLFLFPSSSVLEYWWPLLKRSLQCKWYSYSVSSATKYQVVDPFQASNDFSATVIPATLCCLQQTYLQFIYNQIIFYSIFLSSFCWIIFVELNELVAKNAYILIQELNWRELVELHQVDSLNSEQLRLLFTFADSFSAFDALADFLVISANLYKSF